MELHLTPPPLRPLVLAHRAVRRDVLLLQALLGAPAPEPGAVAGLYRWYRAFRGAVEEHCRAEAVALAPRLRAAGRAELATSMDDGHAAVRDALELAAEAVELLADADDARRPGLLPPARLVVAHLRSVLETHLETEESAVLPALVASTSTDVLAEAGAAFLGALPDDTLWFRRSWLAASLTDAAGTAHAEAAGTDGTGPTGAASEAASAAASDADRYRRITRPLAGA